LSFEGGRLEEGDLGLSFGELLLKAIDVELGGGEGGLRFFELSFEGTLFLEGEP